MTINRGPYTPATACTGAATPGAKALMSWFLGAYGPRGATNLGIYGCRPVAGTATLSVHSEGRADDLGTPVGNPWSGGLADWMRLNSLELGIQCIIHKRRIWSCNHGDAWRTYDGSSAHEEHIHGELTPESAQNLTVARINLVAGIGDEMYFVIREDGPKKNAAGRYGGGTYQFATTGTQLDDWKRLTPGPEVVITHADLDSGRIGHVDVTKIGQVGPHSHTFSGITDPS